MKPTIVSKRLSLSMEIVKSLGVRSDLCGRGDDRCSTGVAPSGCASACTTTKNEERN